MSENTVTVVIIGAGIVGASVAYHLAARGCADVLILEKAKTEATGSTARSAAGVRHQFASEVNIRLSLYSIERLKNFTAEVGGHADLKQVGYLLLVDDPETWAAYQRNVALQNSLGVRTRMLTPEQALDFVPQTALMICWARPSARTTAIAIRMGLPSATLPVPVNWAYG